jgi:hypothetical protein
MEAVFIFETSAGLEDARKDSASTMNHNETTKSVITYWEPEIVNGKDKTGIIMNVF